MFNENPFTFSKLSERCVSGERVSSSKEGLPASRYNGISWKSMGAPPFLYSTHARIVFGSEFPGERGGVGREGT